MQRIAYYFIGVTMCLLLNTNVQSQGSGQWMWTKGDSLTGQYGAYDTLGYFNNYTYYNAYRGYDYAFSKMYNSKFYTYTFRYYFPTIIGRTSNNVAAYSPSMNNWAGYKITGYFYHNPPYPLSIAVLRPCIYSPQGVATSYATPSGRGGALCWSDAQGNTWLYGGKDSMGLRADMWKYVTNANKWMWVGGDTNSNALPVYGIKGIANATNSPGGRIGSITHWVDKQGNFWLFGGAIDNMGNNANDLWKYNPSTLQWTWMNGPNTINDAGNYGTMGISAVSNQPPARSGYAASQDTALNLLVFGGSNRNDVWKYNIATNLWTWVAGTNQLNDFVGNYVGYCQIGTPAARHNWRAAQLVGNFKHLSYIFGGGVLFGNVCNNDLWLFDSNTNQFKWLNGTFNSSANQNGIYGTEGIYAPSNRVPGRSLHGMVVDYGNRLFMFTGLDCSGRMKNDVWRYTPDTSCIPLPICSNSYFTQNITICKNDTFKLPNGYPQTIAGTFVDTIMNLTGCDSVITTHLSVVNNKFITKNSSICANQYYAFHNGKKTNLAGIYKDTIPSISSCDTIYTINLSVINLPTKSIIANICSNQTYTLPSGKIVTTAGLYKDTMANVVGCDSVISVQLTILNTSNNAINKTICSNQSFLFNNQTLTTSGIYKDTLVNYVGCDSIISLQLVVNSISSNTLNEVICNNQFYTLPNGTQASKQGIYKDTLLNISGCDSFITINLSVIDLPQFNLGADTNLCGGNSVILSAPMYSSATYLWNTNSINNVITVDTSGFYYVSVSMPPCTSVADSIKINFIDCDCKVLLPNSFTPNHDGIDETFKPIMACDVEPQQYDFKIYNRWGQKVFSTTLFNTAWDGTFNGSLQEVGAYVFFVSFINPTTHQKEFYKGDVLLLR
jgi:gliding motility-associated-like protein